jgi:hypothetical protein
MDSNGELAILLLRRQIRGYRNNDPAEQPQKAIPFSLLQKLIMLPTKNPMRRRFKHLTHMTFFFAMRSCEYLKVSGKDRRTKAIFMCDIQFRDRFNQKIPRSDPLINMPSMLVCILSLMTVRLFPSSICFSSCYLYLPWLCADYEEWALF